MVTPDRLGADCEKRICDLGRVATQGATDQTRGDSTPAIDGPEARPFFSSGNDEGSADRSRRRMKSGLGSFVVTVVLVGVMNGTRSNPPKRATAPMGRAFRIGCF